VVIGEMAMGAIGALEIDCNREWWAKQRGGGDVDAVEG
jgi:hypothetical protein